MNKTTTVLQVCIAMISLTAALMLQAEPAGHYRWQDARGNTHYSDRPPEGIESVFIKSTTGKRSAPPEPQAANANDKAAENPAAGKKMMEILPEKNPALCKQAQANLNALKGARIRITEPDGSQRFLTEEEKEEQRENARKFIELHCD